MLDHIGVQAADVEASLAFYLRCFSPIGMHEAMRFPVGDSFVVGLAGPNGIPAFWLSPAARPEDRELHVAFRAADRDAVDAVYAAAVTAATGCSSATSTATTSRPCITAASRLAALASGSVHRDRTRRPSKAIVQTASASSAGDVPRRGRYHSIRELTSPKISLAVTAGSMSGRMSPSAAAWPTRSAANRSNSRRRASASRSALVLPCTRSSSVTNGSRSASTATLPRTRRSSRSMAGPGEASTSRAISNRPSSARPVASRSSSSLLGTWW